MPAVLADTTLRLLEDLPPYERGSKDVQATLDVLGRELDRIEAAKDELRANWYATTASAWLRFYEQILGLPVEPGDRSTAQRRASVVARLRNLGAAATGIGWQAAITDVVGTNWSYEEYNPDDPGSLTANILRITLPYGSTLAEGIRDLIRNITPAHVEIDYVYGEGFVIGVSEIGVQYL